MSCIKLNHRSEIYFFFNIPVLNWKNMPFSEFLTYETGTRIGKINV